MPPNLDIEDLALEYYERLQNEGARAMAELRRKHPDHADRILGALEQLGRVALFEDPEVPTDAGDFRLLRRLGGGGMGVVYLAEQVSLGRLVALKFTRHGPFASEKSSARFAREIEAISKLDHPGICTVYEAGHIDSHPYLAMRYVAGESLAARLDRRRSEIPDSDSSQTPLRELTNQVLLIEQVARTLHHAHEHGVVHRDVKPANILLDRDDNPVLVDFGLARDDDTEGISQTGERVGTPAYMSPEQVDPKYRAETRTPVDARTDIYSLAVTLYECLTLELPFQADSREQLYRSILTEPVPNPRRYNPRIDKGLVAILERALEKRPAQRFESALEFAEELRRWRQFEPLLTQRAGPIKRTLSWAHRHPTLASVMVATTLGLCVALLLLLKSEAHRHELRAVKMALSAHRVGSDMPDLAAKLARRSFAMEQTPETFAVLQEYLGHVSSELVAQATGPLVRVLRSADGRHFYAGGEGTRGLLLCDGEVVIDDLPESDSQIPAAAFSPDGRELAVAGGQRVQRYALQENAAPRVLDVGSRLIHGVAYSRDGRLAVACGTDCLVFGEEGKAAVLQSSSPHLWSTALWLDDGRLVAGGRLWDRDLEHATELDLPRSAVSFVRRLECHGSRILVAAQNWIQVLDLETGKPMAGAWPQQRHETGHLDAELSADGGHVVAGSRDGMVTIWDLSRPDKPIQWMASGAVNVTRFLAHDLVAVGTSAGAIHLFRRTGEPVDILRGHTGHVTWIEPVGKNEIYSTSTSGEVRRWNLANLSAVPCFVGLKKCLVAWNVVGDRIALASRGGRVLVLDDNFQLLSERRVAPSRYVSPAFERDDRTLRVISGREGWLLDSRSNDPKRPCPDSKRMFGQFPGLELLQAPIVMEDGTWVLRPSNRRIFSWHPERPESQPRRLVGDAVTAMVSTPAGDGVLYGTWYGKVGLVDLDGKTVWQAPGVYGRILSVAFGNSEETVIATSTDRWAYVFSRTENKATPPRRFGPHLHEVTDATFDLSGERLITASREGKLRIFDSQGKRLAILGGLPQTWFMVHPISGDRFVSVSVGGGTARVWWSKMDALKSFVDKLGPVPEFTELEKQLYPELVR